MEFGEKGENGGYGSFIYSLDMGKKGRKEKKMKDDKELI